jgi:hypothetical protein
MIIRNKKTQEYKTKRRYRYDWDGEMKEGWKNGIVE